MDTHSYLRLIRGESRGSIAAIGRVVFSLASVPYGTCVSARNVAFDMHLRRVTRVERPVVSVGNITLGGTGKTPMVEWVARWLCQRGARVALLSRGYGTNAGLNDEGRVLQANLPHVPHLQGRDRVALALRAINELDARVLVLDDAFQHRRLARDVDIVLLDALEPFGLGRLFPRGMLREPVRSLRRAHVVLLSRADLVDQSTRCAIRAEAERHAGRRAWAEARHVPIDLVDSGGQSMPLDNLTGLRTRAFCGIGNPEGFKRTLLSLGVPLQAFQTFPDHHAYTPVDVDRLAAWILDSGAELALTTQKDLVKLRVKSLGGVPLRALRIGLEFLSGQEQVETALNALPLVTTCYEADNSTSPI